MPRKGLGKGLQLVGVPHHLAKVFVCIAFESCSARVLQDVAAQIATELLGCQLRLDEVNGLDTPCGVVRRMVNHVCLRLFHRDVDNLRLLLHPQLALTQWQG